MSWLQKIADTMFHGTQENNARQILFHGFEVSTSGGGQRGLLGVWLTKDIDTVNLYANSIGRQSDPAVVNVSVPSLNIADLRNGDIYEHWAFLGKDLENPEDQKYIRELQPFALTKALQDKGYDGAWIDNTVIKNGFPELVVFDPNKLNPVSWRLL